MTTTQWNKTKFQN